MPALKPWWMLTVALSSVALAAPAHAAELAQPSLLSPLPGSKLGFANPAFYWAPVEGAASYVVELCRDESCGTILDRAVLDASPLGNEPHWQPKPLAAGTFYWRVTARGGSGPDSPPALAGRLDILSDRLDREPPVAKLSMSGSQAQVAGRLFTPPAPSFEVAAQDAGCGLYIASPVVEGSLETPGEHTLRGYAIDRCGNRVDLPPIVFTVDAEAPTVRSEMVDGAELKKASQAQAAHGAARSTGVPKEMGLYGSADGRRWQPLWRPGQAGAGDEIAGDQSPLFLAARGVKLTIDGQTVEPGEGKFLAIRAEDAGAGVGKLRLHVIPASPASPGGAPALEVEAVDRVGNRRAVTWPLALP